MVRRAIPHISRFVVISVVVFLPQLLVWQMYLSPASVPSFARSIRHSTQKATRFELPPMATSQFALAAAQQSAIDTISVLPGQANLPKRRVPIIQPPVTIDPPVELPRPKEPPIWLPLPIDPPEPYCPPCRVYETSVSASTSLILCPMDSSMRYLCAM